VGVWAVELANGWTRADVGVVGRGDVCRQTSAGAQDERESSGRGHASSGWVSACMRAFRVSGVASFWASLEGERGV
jgi:hypothetical protein